MDKATEEKLKMWQGKLLELQKGLDSVAEKRTEAAENGEDEDSALFQTLEEEASAYQARIEEIKNLLVKMEGGKTSN